MGWNYLSITKQKVMEWISNFNPHSTGHVLKLNRGGAAGKIRFSNHVDRIYSIVNNNRWPERNRKVDLSSSLARTWYHDDVIKWIHFPRYWPFVRGFTGDRWFPITEASDAELWCFLDLRPNKGLIEQSIRRWVEMPWRLSWRHCNDKC